MNIRQALNAGGLAALSSFAAKMQLGDVLRKHVKQDLRDKAPAANTSNLATLEAIPMDPHAPASVIHRAYARTAGGGGGTPGELTVVAYGVTPGTGEIAVAPNGNIVLLAADKYENVDVEYMPADGDLVVLAELPVTANVLTIPTKFATKVVYLLGATATAGTATGVKIPLVPGAGAPAAGQARLNVAKTTVTFAVADAVTKAVVSLYIAKGVLQDSADLDAVLQATAETV